MTTCFAYAVIILLPAYLLKIKLPPGGSLNGLDIVQTLFIISFIHWIITRKQFPAFINFIRQRNRQLLAIFFFLSGLVLAYVSNLTAGNWLSGAGMVKSYFLLPLISAFCITFLVNSEKMTIRGIALAYYCYSTALGLVGLGWLLARQLTYDHRLTVFFESPNFLAMALSPGIIIGLYFFIHHQEHRMTVLLSSAPQIVALWATDSLGAALGMAAAMAILLLAAWSKQIFYAIFTLSLATLAIILSLPAILTSFGYTPASPPSSADSRLAIYRSAGQILENHWFIGIGPGNFQSTYLSYQRFFPPYPQWAVPHPHNLLLAVWTELGVLSFLSFCYLLAWRLSHLPKDHALLILALASYFLVHGLVDTTLWKNDLAQFFWIIVLL